MQDNTKAAEFHAEVRQVKSMVDHTYNVTFNFSEDMLEVVQKIMECIGLEVTGAIVFDPK
jgi:hypothetical protein